MTITRNPWAQHANRQARACVDALRKRSVVAADRMESGLDAERNVTERLGYVKAHSTVLLAGIEVRACAAAWRAIAAVPDDASPHQIVYAGTQAAADAASDEAGSHPETANAVGHAFGMDITGQIGAQLCCIVGLDARVVVAFREDDNT